jgi:hypothetical protein
MAVRKFYLTIGQSNAGPSADAQSWWLKHTNLALWSTDANIRANNFARGSYSDTFVMPGSIWTNYGTLSLSGVAISGLRYLTFWDPYVTGMSDYPGTGRVTVATSTTQFQCQQFLEEALPSGFPIVRVRTGVTHTVSSVTNIGASGQVWTVNETFVPPIEVGETFTYRWVASSLGNSTTVMRSRMLLGQEWGGVGTGVWTSSLEGCRLKCTSVSSGSNLNEIRTISNVALVGGTKARDITVATAFPSAIDAGDTFEVLPPANTEWHKWSYFLPWSPFEGKVNATKNNPYPPGFNYPPHHDVLPVYNPFTGPTRLWVTFERAAYHVGLGIRLQEYFGETMYAVSLAVGGSSLGHRELRDNDYAMGWFDSAQQTYWAPGEGNNCFARLLDTLDAAVSAAAIQGDTLQCIGIFFAQGEGDTIDPLFANNYRTALQRLKTAVRQALVDRGLWSKPASQIPWVQPKIKDITTWVYADIVNKAIATEALADPYMRTFEVQDYPLIPNDVHYTGEGMTLMEQDAFDAWRDIQLSSYAITTLDVAVCNLALSFIGDTAAITSIDPPDGSAQSTLCAQFYLQALQSTLEMHAWEFATRKVALEQVTFADTSTSDRIEWDYAYKLPSRFLRAICVLPPGATDDYKQSVDYSIEVNADGVLCLYTDQEEATLRYTELPSSPRMWSPNFRMVVAWHLASMLAGPIIKGDVGAAESKRCIQMMGAYLSKAASADSMDRRIHPEHNAPWISGR